MTTDRPSHLVPRLRFPGFRNAPDWRRTALGTLLDRPPEYGVNAAAVPFSEDLPAYIRITDIDNDGRFVPAPLVSVDIEPNEDHYLQPGDIVFARTGASVGKSYCHLGEGGRLVYAGFLIRVRPNPARLSPQFLAAYLSTCGYWDWVRLTSARSGQPGINGTEYASMRLPLPPDGRHLAEQQEIADCLSSLDDLIAAVDRKLEALRQHKQGLMQQLFPQPGETVPRLRFPRFRGTGDCHIQPISDIAQLNKEQVYPASTPKERFAHYSIPAYDAHGAPILEMGSSIGSAKFVVPQDAILLSKLNPRIPRVWKPMVPKEITAVASTEFLVLRPKQDVARQYLHYLCQSYAFRAGLQSRVAGTSRSHQRVHPRDALSLTAWLPPVSEQRAIADFLTSTDDQLNAQAHKLDMLKTHKQGLLQQLFPRLEAV